MDITQVAAPPASSRSPWKGTDVLIICVVALAVIGAMLLPAAVALRVLHVPRTTSLIAWLTVYSTLAEVVGILSSVYLLGIWRKHLKGEEIGLRGASCVWLFAAVALGFVALFLSGLIAALVQMLLGLPSTNPQAPFIEPAGSNPLTATAMVLFAGLLAPFAEELLFRGVIYNWLRGRWSVAPAILVSSLLFGAAHLDITVGSAAFVLGIILALAYEESRSLLPNVLIHAMNNTLKLVLLYVLMAGGRLGP